MIAEPTADDVVVDEGEHLAPLDSGVPPKVAWTGLACPLCGSWLLKGRRIHTLRMERI